MPELFALIMECRVPMRRAILGIEVLRPRGALVLVGETAAPLTIEKARCFRRKDFT